MIIRGALLLYRDDERELTLARHVPGCGFISEQYTRLPTDPRGPIKVFPSLLSPLARPVYVACFDVTCAASVSGRRAGALGVCDCLDPLFAACRGFT
jgi:hypothetical protein